MNFFENGVTGHRGDPQHFPENTIEGFAGAMALGCDWVETDLRFTRDGRIVLSHDGNTAACADRRREIAETSFEELRRLNMAEFFNMVHEERPAVSAVIPALEEALELFRSQDRVRLSLQPKVPDILPVAEQIIRRMNVPEELLGFNDGNLEFMIEARRRFPGATIFYDICGTDQLEAALEAARRNRFDAIVANENYLTGDDVNRILEANFVPGVWNLNNPGEMDRFSEMGVKRFYTDFPSVLLRKKSQAR